MPGWVIAIIVLVVALFLLTAVLLATPAWGAGLIAGACVFFLLRNRALADLQDERCSQRPLVSTLTTTGLDIRIDEKRLSTLVQERQASLWTQFCAIGVTILVGIVMAANATGENRVFLVVGTVAAALIVGLAVNKANPNAALERDMRKDLDGTATRLRGTNIQMKELEARQTAILQLARRLAISLEVPYADSLRRRVQDELDGGRPDVETLTRLGDDTLREAEKDFHRLEHAAQSATQLQDVITSATPSVLQTGSEAFVSRLDLLLDQVKAAQQQLLSSRKWEAFDEVIKLAVKEVKELGTQAERYVSQGSEGPAQARARLTLEEAFDILGVGPNTANDEIKAAYRRLAMQCHPDQKGSDGLFKLLTAAMDLVCEARGIHR